MKKNKKKRVENIARKDADKPSDVERTFEVIAGTAEVGSGPDKVRYVEGEHVTTTLRLDKMFLNKFKEVNLVPQRVPVDDSTDDEDEVVEAHDEDDEDVEDHDEGIDPEESPENQNDDLTEGGGGKKKKKKKKKSI